MKSTRPGMLAALLGAALLIAACGSTTFSGAGHAAANQTGSASSPANVIRAWSSALRRGDVAAAARYFALPSKFADGLEVDGAMAFVTIHTEAQAITVNSSLSCGSVVISTRPQGRYVSALFRLTSRKGPGAGCGSGVGQLARTDFLIKHGRIVDWIRAPVSGGGTPTGPSTSTVPTTPTTSDQPDPVV